jgi:hypothetical protein
MLYVSKWENVRLVETKDPTSTKPTTLRSGRRMEPKVDRKHGWKMGRKHDMN